MKVTLQSEAICLTCNEKSGPSGESWTSNTAWMLDHLSHHKMHRVALVVTHRVERPNQDGKAERNVLRTRWEQAQGKTA